jgi:hypothetical protein
MVSLDRSLDRLDQDVHTVIRIRTVGAQRPIRVLEGRHERLR